jgi:hypothetical protein
MVEDQARKAQRTGTLLELPAGTYRRAEPGAAFQAAAEGEL